MEPTPFGQVYIAAVPGATLAKRGVVAGPRRPCDVCQDEFLVRLSRKSRPTSRRNVRSLPGPLCRLARASGGDGVR